MVIDKKRIMNLLLNSIQDNFKEEGRPRWIKSRLAQLENRKTLTRTGRLKNSIIGRIVGNVVEISTNVFYGKFHQYGTKHLPIREFLMFQEKDIDEIRSIIINSIIQSWGKK